MKLELTEKGYLIAFLTDGKIIDYYQKLENNYDWCLVHEIQNASIFESQTEASNICANKFPGSDTAIYSITKEIKISVLEL